MPLAAATVLTVSIANGASLSNGVQIGAGALVGIILPTFTSAALSFQSSEDGVTYREAFDAAGVAITVAATTGNCSLPAPAALKGAPWLKVRSGTSGAPVTQGADRYAGRDLAGRGK
jgi:hypothetical protein